MNRQLSLLVLLSGFIFGLTTDIEAVLIDRVPALVDNMEDGDGGNRWSGVWYTFADGTSTISPAAGAAFHMTTGGSPESPVYAAHINWTLRAGAPHPFVGVGTSLSSPRGAVNCGAYNGIRLRVRGTGNYQLRLPMWGDSPNEGGRGDYAFYRATFTASAEWRELRFNWAVPGGGDFRLPTWADPGPFNPTILVSIQVVPAEGTAMGTSGELFIDDLAFLPYTPPTARETRPARVIDDCNDGDSVNALGGFWHTYSDAPVGTTVVDPPVGSTFTMTAGGAQGTAFGARMSWTLDPSPPPEHPIAGMGTVLGASATDVLDARNYAGIRVFARGTRHHILRLVMPTDDPARTSSYQVGIPPSADWTEYVFSWGDFSLPAWVAEHGTTMANRPLDISRISAFQVQAAFTGHNPHGTSGEISVDEIVFTGIPLEGNLPPNIPETPSGATAGIVNTPYTYLTSATDPDGHQVRYVFDWGDGTTSETISLVNSGTPDSASRSWSTPGIYSVRARAIDAGGRLTSEWSTVLTVTIGEVGANQSPLTPSTPVGPATGIVNTTHTYSTSATDPNADQVRYIFDWSDGTFSTTTLVNSGTLASASRMWLSTGTYSIRARAIDSHGALSGWSTVFTVTISATAASRPPNIPPILIGPTAGIVNTPYTYSTFATDPEGNQVMYVFDWGDGTPFSTTTLVNSGATASDSRSWSAPGTYLVRARAIDSYGVMSEWSTAISVTISTRPADGVTPPVGVIYPTDSPFNPAKGEITVFRNLSAGGTVKIYTLVGELVRTLNESNNEATWDGKDKDGNTLPSGVYHFIAGDKRGKVVILR